MMEDLSNTISSSNASIVLNGAIFNLNSFTSEGAKNDFEPDKFDTVVSSSLIPDSGVLIDPSRGLMLAVGDGINSSIGTVTLNSINVGVNSNIDLPSQGTLLSTADLGNDSTGSSFITVQPDQVTGQTLVPSGSVNLTGTTLQLPVVSAPVINSIQAKPADNEDNKKRKGGWPKGKKRKQEIPRAGPRAPASAYVLFAIERRHQIKETNPEFSFRDVTRILGGEWSAMSNEGKQKYMDEAAADKQRYITELKEYQQSDDYQIWLRKKKQKMKDAHNKTDDPMEFLDNTGYSSIEEDGLFCRLCNLYFSSSHNKREHFYGKQHLNNVTAEFEKEKLNTQNETTSDSDLLNSDQDSICMPGHRSRSDSEHGWSSGDESMIINSFVTKFIEQNQVREKEAEHLRNTVATSKNRHMELQETLRELKNKEIRLKRDLVNSQAIGASLSAQIDGLKMVPSLFGVLISDDLGYT